MSKGQIIGYIRVSTTDQHPDRQVEGIKEAGIVLDKSFTDFYTAKDTSRPQFQAMMDYLREGDTLIVHSMDRLARNLDDLRQTVQILTRKGIAVQFVKEHLTFTGDDSPMAILLLSVMGAFAEFERSIMRERQREGIAIAKGKGVYKGRKPSLSEKEELEIVAKVRAGGNRSAIAKEYRISRETLYKCVRRSGSGTVSVEGLLGCG